ncbi:MAG: hypothetical protein ACP5HG_15345 [Anaerolineae bacterium]
MLRTLFAIFVILHGLVHLWFVVLSQELIEVKPEMGWTPYSWLFTRVIGDAATRWLATVLSVLLALTFLVSGIGLLAGAAWWRAPMIVAAAVSAALIAVYWDGGTRLLVEKGLVGFLIDVGILIALLVVNWPSAP